ncbi:unnamed protein product [Umbelopsis sp. WA50703]
MNSTVEARIQTVDSHYTTCKQSIDRLQRLYGDIAVQQELASLVRDQVRTFAHVIQGLRQLADEQDTESAQQNVLERYSLGEKQLKLQASSRKALLESKKRADEQAKRDREMLFSSKAGRNMEQYELKDRRNTSQDQSLLRASNDVTESLKRTSTLMQQELERSAFTTTVLADSSRTMSSTHSEYQNFGSLLTLSKSIITKLETSDWLDRIMLMLGLLFFLSVVIYIVKKRTWDVGVSWASWLMGKGGRKAVKVAQSATQAFTHTATQAATQATTSILESIHTSAAESGSSTTTVVSEVSTTLDTIVEQATSILKDEL